MAATKGRYGKTKISEGQTLHEIESLLERHGVTTIRTTRQAGLMRIEFAWPWKGMTLPFRIDLNLTRNDAKFAYQDQRDQERRRLMRVMLYHIEAKLLAVEEGLVDMEEEFLPYLLGPGGQTAGDEARVQLKRYAATGQIGALDLLALPEPKEGPQ